MVRLFDIWQAHSDGDVLELHVTRDPGDVSGLSDNDPDSDQDPVPFLNRDRTAPNGTMIGRERLMAGDRLGWLSDHDGTKTCVVFEMHDFCQVTSRTWNLRLDSDGMPLLLNFVTRSPSPSIRAAIREILALGAPRTWAPRNPESHYWSDWVPPATRSPQPEHWLTQLRPRRRRR